ncbi:PREDICTED: pentatricopeptide repeat-containing protein At5g40410, mitochondrial [Nelumbo nucifera]|uniref:DYW domain-containing protein n=2 Tax=Nelumbo nucifera TaxID=4432 RepID=A0A822ZTI0_NELNU|nr:PREDICTED: pentatricopeptide repeat-containing protein At5g40410, mitochondrial [Nelumbo nucifera]DAD46665.1 TPA_asm: hypothetical protein HUJ06_016602 [Nelumbo nucifera]
MMKSIASSSSSHLYSSLDSLLYFCLKPKICKCTHRKSPFLYNLIPNERSIYTDILPPHSPRISAEFTLNSVVPQLLSALKSSSSVFDCQVIHAQLIQSGKYNFGFIGDQLVAAYAKFDRVVDARNLFDEMPNKDLVSWNSMISVLSRRGDLSESLDVFRRMRWEMGIKPNEVTLISVLPACSDMQALDGGRYIHGYTVKLGFESEVKVVNSLINMYGKCGAVDAAYRLFDAMPTRNLVSWNSMVAICSQYGFDEGLEIFNLMRRAGIVPDRATMVTLLHVSTDLVTVTGKQAKSIHGCIVSCGLNLDVTVATALITVYAKSGSLGSSHEVFCELNNPDRIAWTAMLAGYAKHGHGRDAVDFFHLMIKEGEEPDHVTFTHLLNACSHSGLVNEGKTYFEVMSKVYGIEPRMDHYSCMVDLLGRSGHLEEAYELIERMPFKPNAAVWGALLGACRVHHKIELGKEVAEKLFSLEPLDPRNYIILSNMYSASGLWTEASKVRILMKQRGLRKNSGCSFIEHGNKIHRFAAGDWSHPESDRIYKKLEELVGRMREAGFVSQTGFVLHDVDEEVKEDMINQHSEKLAIAFGLLVMGTGRPIMITKNLRICGDCHSAAKFISFMEKHSIIIRDSKRFHHFADGFCSCGDYW